MFAPDVPGRVVGADLVEVGDGDRVLGLLLVVADAGVLEPVAPQDLVGQVGGADLQHPVLHQLCIRNLHISYLWCQTVKLIFSPTSQSSCFTFGTDVGS